jgi:hypothetical protein
MIGALDKEELEIEVSVAARFLEYRLLNVRKSDCGAFARHCRQGRWAGSARTSYLPICEK